MAKTSVADTPAHPIERQIHTIREYKVMLDADLAALYGVDDAGSQSKPVQRNVPRGFRRTSCSMLTPDGQRPCVRSQSVIASKRKH